MVELAKLGYSHIEFEKIPYPKLPIINKKELITEKDIDLRFIKFLQPKDVKEEFSVNKNL